MTKESELGWEKIPITYTYKDWCVTGGVLQTAEEDGGEMTELGRMVVEDVEESEDERNGTSK